MNILANLEKANTMAMRLIHAPRSRDKEIMLIALNALLEGVKEVASTKENEDFHILGQECEKALYVLNRIEAYGINEKDMWYVESTTYRMIGIASMLRLAELL